MKEEILVMFWKHTFSSRHDKNYVRYVRDSRLEKSVRGAFTLNSFLNYSQITPAILEEIVLRIANFPSAGLR